MVLWMSKACSKSPFFINKQSNSNRKRFSADIVRKIIFFFDCTFLWRVYRSFLPSFLKREKKDTEHWFAHCFIVIFNFYFSLDPWWQTSPSKTMRKNRRQFMLQLRQHFKTPNQPRLRLDQVVSDQGKEIDGSFSSL